MILVTGASGFLGQHLVRFLSAQRCQVRALYNNHVPPREMLQLPGLSWVKYDLLDIYDVEELMQGITDVYHCAAIMSFNPAEKNEMLHFNVESTANIVNQALEQGIRKMLYVSSVSALGRNERKEVEITEEEQWEENKHNSSYGLSKYAGEIEVWRGIGEGLNGVIVNPGIILGAGNWNTGSSRLMQVAYGEFPFYTGGITAWVDVEDVVKIMYLLMESDISGERFILSSGNFAYLDIFTQMAMVLNKKPPYIRAASFMSSLVWRWYALKQKLGGTPLITKETARNAQNHSYYNNQKLFKFLPGFSYIPIANTIQAMGRSFLADLERK